MTKFVKENFDIGSGSEVWVYYHPNGIGLTKFEDRLFIGRYKYGSPKACANHDVKHLIKHVTVEEWQKLQAMPQHDPEGKTPWVDLTKARDEYKKSLFEDRGHIQYNILKALKQHGFTKYSELQAYNRACADVNQKAREQGRTASRYEYPAPSQFIGA